MTDRREAEGLRPADPAEVVFALSERGQTVAVAESLTGGMVCSALVDVAGVSAVLRGGVVAYATELKHRLLGVDARLLAANGPVDPDVAAQMAHGVRELLGADWGLATTGVAGPDPQDGIAAGTVFIAVAGPLVRGPLPAAQAVAGAAFGPGIGTRVERLDLAGGRAEVRAQTTARVIAALLAEIQGRSQPNG